MALQSCLPSLGSLVGAVANMSLWKSDAVNLWVSTQRQNLYKPRFVRQGLYNSPRLSRRIQAKFIKNALLKGEFKLEPTVMVPPPKFKGHKRHLAMPIKAAEVARKMEEMPAMIAEYRAKVRADRAKRRADNMFK